MALHEQEKQQPNNVALERNLKDTYASSITGGNKSEDHSSIDA